MILESAVYTKLPEVPVNGAVDPVQFEQWLAREVTHQLKVIENHTRLTIAHHFVTSTVFTNTFNRGCLKWPRMRQIIEQQTGQKPATFLNAYECAGWGYILRLVQQLGIKDEAFCISIIDINAYEYDYWKSSSHWGSSGFGVCSLLFRNSGDRSCFTVSTSTSLNAFTNFALGVRKKLLEDGSMCAALPFFPEPTQKLLDHTLAASSRLTNRHAKWGHCFGADPWLSIILSREEQFDFSAYSAVLACSLALNGYYCTAKVTFNEEGIYKLLPASSPEKTGKSS